MHFKVAHIRGFWGQLRAVISKLSRKIAKLGADIEELRLDIVVRLPLPSSLSFSNGFVVN